MTRRVDVGGEHLDGPALAEVTREDAVLEAAIRLVEAWQDAAAADQAQDRAQPLTPFAFISRFCALQLLDAVTALQQAGGT